MNGLEATAVIKELNPNVPVVAQTAYAMVGDENKALAAGCDDYITKPIKKETIRRILEKYFKLTNV